MNITYKPISELIPYVNNPRKNDKAVDAVASSIKNYGFRQPIVIDAKNEIIIGHTRLLAAKKLKMDSVPCAIVDDLTPQQIKGLRIADNKVAEYSEWDIDLLKIELDGLDEFTGFEIDELNMMFEEEKEITEDEVPEVEEEVITKLGDLYEIGEHRLLCGDSTDGEQVARLMNDKKADMVFTDPPYLITTQGGGVLQKHFKKTAERIKNIVNFEPKKWLQTLPVYFNGNMNTFIFCNKDLILDYLNYSKENNYNFNILVWCKKQVVPFTGGHHYSDIEYIIYLSKKPIFNNGLKGVEYRKYFVLDNEKSKEHPTIKPVKIILNEIQIASNKNGIVSDCFMGSGTTMVACHQLNRKCYGMELEPKYCDVIIRRMINLDPDITIKRNGIECKQEFRK
jgi:DNA modification methylase